MPGRLYHDQVDGASGLGGLGLARMTQYRNALMTGHSHQGASLSRSMGTAVMPPRLQQSGRFSVQPAYRVAYERRTFM
jgi:hypothetical protein